jgi:membrane-anchored mycosin MYCP
VLRRALAVATVLAAAIALASEAEPASARAISSALAMPRVRAESSDLQPLPGQWWFSAWDIQTRVWPLTMGAGVTVGLVDSGVQASLPDLRGAVVPGADTGGGHNRGMTDTYGADGHGTAMAALIAGQGVDGGPVGIAPAAKVLPVDVGGPVGGLAGTDATDAAGIRYAVRRGVQVINMSFGGVTASASGCDPVLQDAVAYALQHNVVVVASAGDLGASGNPPMQPASCAGVLAVGAVSPNLTLWSGSERQPYVAVTAPGNEVGLLGLDGRYFPDGWGTSQAAALVSGAVALVRSRYPSMPWYAVVQRIINTGLPKGDTVPNNSFGYGIVRIPGALNASRYPVPASDPNPVYDAYQQWLATPQGEQFAHPAQDRARPRSHPARGSPVAARGSSAGSGVPAGVIAAVGAAALCLIALSLVAIGRRRRGGGGASPAA